MRNLILLTYILSLGVLNAQSLNDFGNVPETVSKSTDTAELLKQLNWESIDKFCQSNDGFYSYKREKGLLTEYKYVKQGRVEWFEIISFKGKVLEFYLDIPNLKKTNKHFFNKELWIQYAKEMLPDLADSLLLSEVEPTKLLKGFYALLGVDTEDEYGWICEYSAVGMAPARRQGVIELIKYNRIDLLRKLFYHSNSQVRLYAIDALIYMDKESNILNNQDWQEIYKFRDSGTIIKTCGNMGSYKIYGTPIANLLSKKAIKQISKRYNYLKEMGYFRE
jgi:hypothetical protein